VKRTQAAEQEQLATAWDEPSEADVSSSSKEEGEGEEEEEEEDGSTNT